MSALYRVLTASSKDSNERNGVGEVLAAAATASVTQLPLGRGSPRYRRLPNFIRVRSVHQVTLTAAHGVADTTTMPPESRPICDDATATHT